MTSTTSTSETPTMLPQELTLIVAATSKMGIGKAGTLPWTGLKNEMAYFARVTKRAESGVSNTVIMGRKTWDSIPPRFRPLKDRINIVVTRSASSSSFSLSSDNHIIVDSLKSSLRALSQEAKGRAFVIGGAQIYKAALEIKETKRILLTRVLTDFECDTFFPVALGEDEKGQGEEWEKKSKVELDEWVRESVPEGVQEENGTMYIFEMWERRGK